ncbi:MAG: hypothetical protein FJW39_31220 [Acidobacteria bacterium]|nr:hypothetical protein [Acidobacteriota bacterium]
MVRLAAALLVCVTAFSQTAPQTYVPPTWKERRTVFLKKMFGPQALVETVPGAAFDTAREFPSSWGRGAGGFGKRTLSQYGQFAVGEGIEMGVAAFRKEDPRYHRAGEGAAFSKRIGRIVASGVVTRNHEGNRTIALSRLGNIYGSWAIASRWNPPEVRSARSVFLNGSLGLGIKVGGNAFREFWPDIKKRLKRQ